MFRKLLLAKLLLCWCLWAADPPEDPAVALAKILAAKGTITASELSSVQASGPGDRVGALAAILQRKGVLSEAELAQFRPAPAAPSQSAIAAKAPTTSQTQEHPVTTKGGPSVSLYGTVLTNAFFNTAATNIQDMSQFVLKQGSESPASDKSLGMTARQTRLGLRFQQANVVGAKLSGQFEFDLFGGKTPLPNGMDMDMFRLRLAFGRLDWTHFAFEAGQDWAVFAPLNPTSLAMYAVPEFAASGNPWNRLPQLRAEYKIGASDGNRLLWQVAALDPNMGDYPLTPFSTSRQPGIGERGRMPALESRVAWTGHANGEDLTIGLSGHYGRGRNFLEDIPPAFQAVDAWGVALDYTPPFSHLFHVTGEAFTGRALGQCAPRQSHWSCRHARRTRCRNPRWMDPNPIQLHQKVATQLGLRAGGAERITIARSGTAGEIRRTWEM
jgi:hypothetical protein